MPGRSVSLRSSPPASAGWHGGSSSVPARWRRGRAYAIVGLSWFALALFGTLPYLLTGEISSFTNAFFETTAGFTTTGSSISPDPSTFSHGILFWRALTQWLGGMGIIILSIAILPLLGIGGVELARAEAPGVSPDRLTPRFRETAKRLWFSLRDVHRSRDSAALARRHDSLRGHFALFHDDVGPAVSERTRSLSAPSARTRNGS